MSNNVRIAFEERIETLPLSQLLGKLKSQTNLRVVADAGAPGGYRLEAGPFPGWAVLPEWDP